MRHARINAAYGPLYDVESRYVVLYGGRRSAKSYSASQLLVRKACEHVRRIVVLRKYATSIRYSVWDRVRGAIDETLGLKACETNKGERRITLPNGSEFIFVGADDPEKLKSIEMVTDYWLEEATEFEKKDFDVLDAGMSTPCDPPPQMWFTFNPVPVITGYQHWLQERFLGIKHKLGEIKTEGRVSVFRTWFRNNAFCPQHVIDTLEGYKETSPDLWKMWGLGEFAHLRGAILTNYDLVDSPPENISPLGYGLDFGFADDPAAVVKVWKRRREIWVEEYVCGSGMTNPDLSQTMKDAGIRPGIDSIVADSAEPKSIEELRRMKWVITGADKYPDYKREAALFLQGHTIHVVGASPTLKKEIATWSWKQDPKDPDKVIPIVADGNDHTIDALIYRTFQKGGSLTADDLSRARSNEKPYIRQSVVKQSIAAVAM